MPNILAIPPGTILTNQDLATIHDYASNSRRSTWTTSPPSGPFSSTISTSIPYSLETLSSTLGIRTSNGLRFNDKIHVDELAIPGGGITVIIKYDTEIICVKDFYDPIAMASFKVNKLHELTRIQSDVIEIIGL